MTDGTRMRQLSPKSQANDLHNVREFTDNLNAPRHRDVVARQRAVNRCVVVGARHATGQSVPATVRPTRHLAGRNSMRLDAIASCASSGRALFGESHPRSIGISGTAGSFLQPTIFDRSITRSKSPWRIRTRTRRFRCIFEGANACRDGSGWRSSSARLRSWRPFLSKAKEVVGAR
jgi:hypothetical protein